MSDRHLEQHRANVQKRIDETVKGVVQQILDPLNQAVVGAMDGILEERSEAAVAFVKRKVDEAVAAERERCAGLMASVVFDHDDEDMDDGDGGVSDHLKTMDGEHIFDERCARCEFEAALSAIRSGQ